jgi:DNA mismatch repair ATPase MutS
MLYDVKNTLYKRICNLNTFIKEAAKIITALPADIAKPFVKLNRNVHNDLQTIDLNNKFSNIYKIWKDNSLKEKLSNILVNIYIIDIINSISKQIYRNKDWCVVSYDNSCTKFWNIKNPILNKEQTANPVSLSKNIVITGPNAAGKTTYVKSILSNIILAQTFGIAYAIKGNVIVYDTIASFMRISDILGSKSYFEVEAEYCLKMMQNAQDLSKHNKKGLFLMDEPMHSTPPTEGMATAYAVAEYIGKLQGITIILTTHFHKLIQLETKYMDKFINLSVEAIPKKNGGFDFPYKIKKGYSYQCIAIELLSSKDFPKSVIDSAINMKNKICAEISR